MEMDNGPYADAKKSMPKIMPKNSDAKEQATKHGFYGDAGLPFLSAAKGYIGLMLGKKQLKLYGSDHEPIKSVKNAYEV